MSAKPGAYDDLASAYAAETGHRRLHGWLDLAADRFNNRRPSLSDYNMSETTDSQAALVEDVFDPESRVLRTRKRFFTAPDRIRRASSSGGAANKARWDAIKAAKKLKAAA